VFSVPPVIDTNKFKDVGTRNQAINASYHQYDLAITAYLGEPYVANWATFGKHASAHVGNEMSSCEESLRLIDSLDVVAKLNSDLESGNLPDAIHDVNQLIETVNKLNVLLQKKNVVNQTASMALHFLTDLVHRLKVAISSPGNPIARARDVIGVLEGFLPNVRHEISVMHDQLADGNKKIYDNIAPSLTAFLQQVQAAPEGVTGLSLQDPDGFMTAALSHYVEARRLTNALHDPQFADDKELLARRLAEVKQGNVILVTHEQMVAQPDYDAMQPQMEALSGQMVLVDPTGAHALLPNGGNWGDFDSRLGYDPATAPKDPHKIDPNNLPPMLDKSDPRYKGTIFDYFDQNAEQSALAAAPKQPTF
jgi:hypothetical protein